MKKVYGILRELGCSQLYNIVIAIFIIIFYKLQKHSTLRKRNMNIYTLFTTTFFVCFGPVTILLINKPIVSHISLAKAEFLKVTVSRSCDRAKMF